MAKRIVKPAEGDIVEIKHLETDKWIVGRVYWTGSAIFGHEARDGTHTTLGYIGSVEWRKVK